jgi:LysM repeat protein
MTTTRSRIIVLTLFFAGIFIALYLAYQPAFRSHKVHSSFEYEVKEGDTCSKIAVDFGVSIVSIVQSNDLKPDCNDIYTGQVLAIPYPTPTLTPPGFIYTSPTPHVSIIDCERVLYTVKNGDTLEKIARKYNVQVDAIKEYNGIVNESYAQTPGNPLLIPLCLRSEQTPHLNSTVTPYPIVDTWPVCREIIFTVQQGDTLDIVSLYYAVSKEYIMQYNRLKTDELSSGMNLLIPMCSNMPIPTITPKK